MNELLDKVIAAHGGLDRWSHVQAVTAEVNSWGRTWTLKGQPSLFSGGNVEAKTGSQAVQIYPFTGEGRRGFYTPERVRIAAGDGTVLEDREHPRAAFAGQTLETPWDHLHGLYFGGYALWTYFNLPFVAARRDFDVQEIEPWHEGPGRNWRRLRLTFPPHIATHNPVQDLYIDSDGLIVRHDYSPEVLGSNPAAHYLYDHADYDGIMFPRLRKVFPRGVDNRADPSDSESLLIGLKFDGGYRLS